VPEPRRLAIEHPPLCGAVRIRAGDGFSERRRVVRVRYMVASVVEASSGAAALDLLRQTTDIDLVVTDQAMPGMTGSELARQIRSHWPDLPVILATGYADLANQEDPGWPRLAKPYQRDELTAAIARVFELMQAGGNVVPLDAARRA